MSNIRKHTDVVSTLEEFTTNYEQGFYTAPWVVYIGNDTEGYSVVYSNDEGRAGEAEPELLKSLSKRVEALETEKVFCTEDEYDELVTNGKAWITNFDGSKIEVSYDPNKLYCIYEDDGPETEVTE